MVSKAAVIAIVAILAVPILLGYALNVEQVTETDYKTTGDPMNVTQLLQTGTNYTYASADVYQLNTNFSITPVSNSKVMPMYQGLTTAKTSLPVQEYGYGIDGGQMPGQLPPGTVPGRNLLSIWNYLYFQSNITAADNTNYVNLSLVENGSAVAAVTRLHTMYWDATTSTIKYTHFDGGILTSGELTVSNPGQTEYVFSGPGTYTATGYLLRSNVNPSSIPSHYYVDFAAGFKFISSEDTGGFSTPYYKYSAVLPQHSRSATFTIDLSSITDNDYVFDVLGYRLTKSTDAGIVKWTVTSSTSDPIDPFDLYYDQSSSSNTYQVKTTIDETSAVSIGSGMIKYTAQVDFRYVGSWPQFIGEANYYQSYSLQKEYIKVGSPELPSLSFGGYSVYSPLIRIDAAEFKAFEYPVVENKTYEPASFKTNPATTINNIQLYGPSFTFGGNTYSVSKGNITMGTHNIPVNGLVLSSVPNPNGGYDNKIGNTVISTTAAPSAITFNGKWSASISTTAQEEYQVTKTEWKAGDFAWDGIDQNFIMAGLLASLGAFIGVGIYARRTKSSVWPLLIVCGGAALLFFVML